MAAPANARANRWSQVVNGVVTLASQQVPLLNNATSADVDAWLNAMWVNPAAENDRNDLRAVCVRWLEANQPDALTLPRALHMYCDL